MLIIFPENQVNKVSAVLQFKHAEKMSCFVGLLCCFVGQYSLHREGNLLYTELEVEVPKKKNCLVIINVFQ